MVLKGRSAGGKLVGQQPQRLRRKQFSPGGYLIGPSHDEGGIGAIIDNEEPIEVEGGEFIVRKSMVDHYGLDFLHRLNQGLVSDEVQSMQRGGKLYPNRKSSVSKPKPKPRPSVPKPRPPISAQGQCSQNPTEMCPPPSPGYSGDWYANCCKILGLL